MTIRHWLSAQSCLRVLVAMLLVGCGGQTVMGEDESTAKAEVDAITALLQKTQPDIVIEKIQPSPIPGLYEVLIANGQAIYISKDAKYLIPGDLYESVDEGLVNLGDGRRTEARLAKIQAIDEKDMIVYEPANGRKATLTVFTDVDCPYCRKLHGEIEDLNKLGIAVRYLAYPRQGLQGETYTRMISTWCSDDRNAAMTSAKRGGDLPVTECDSPVEEQFEIGRQVGVTGTPALVMEDGTILPGYVPAETLATYVFASQQAAAPSN